MRSSCAACQLSGITCAISTTLGVACSNQHFGRSIGLQFPSSQVEHSRTKAGIPFVENNFRARNKHKSQSLLLICGTLSPVDPVLIRAANCILLVLSGRTLCHRVHGSGPSLQELRNATSETTLERLVSNAVECVLVSSLRTISNHTVASFSAT